VAYASTERQTVGTPPTSPTIERQMHGPLTPPLVDDTQSRRFWAVVDPVERLFDTRLITVREKAAANRFRAAWDAAFSGTLKAHDWSAVYAGKNCGRPAGLLNERRTDALAWLGRIRKQLGSGCFTLLEAVLVSEICWAELGRRMRRCPRTARTRAAAALAALAALG
jgi:hypothetical protein